MLERALHPASCETLRGLLPDRSSPLLSERGFVPLAACAAPRAFVFEGRHEIAVLVSDTDPEFAERELREVARSKQTYPSDGEPARSWRGT